MQFGESALSKASQNRFQCSTIFSANGRVELPSVLAILKTVPNIVHRSSCFCHS